MNILYIGQYTSGTTSKMRAEQLKEIIHTSPLGNREVNFNVIDTHIPFNNTTRLWRSIGFRYKCGPLIKKINRYIIGDYMPSWEISEPESRENTEHVINFNLQHEDKTQSKDTPSAQKSKSGLSSAIWWVVAAVLALFFLFK